MDASEQFNPDYAKEGILYEPVIPRIRDWNIYKFSRRREEVVQQVADHAVANIEVAATESKKSLIDIIEQTMYMERSRMTDNPWRVDQKDEKDFWSSVKEKLVQNEQLATDGDKMRSLQDDRALINEISRRYAEEIAGNFDAKVYHFAKRFIPFFFSSILNAVGSGSSLRAIFNHKVQLQDRVRLTGEIEMLRSLATQGTVILVPTHSSNADSILVGWALHAIGVPAFIYGAGLNLFNTKIVAYFIHRLGAYKVDRRKKNSIYLETLKSYSTQALRAGCHMLFFPGGTRSRSNHIEKRLKLGILSTAIETQRMNCVEEKPNSKVFVVPCVIGYHFVLEAKSLIRQYLKSTGREQYYLIGDESNSLRRLLRFFWHFAGKSSEFSLSFGKPMDVFGNFVDANGNSFTRDGRQVDVADYFRSKGEITEDAQRDGEYTRVLGEHIAERYKVEYQVFSSHLVAFVAFEWLKKKYHDMDLYSVLRLPVEDREIPLKDFVDSVDRVYAQVRALTAEGKIKMAEHLYGDALRVVEHGVKNVGAYHENRVLRFERGSFITSESLTLLYFYHNRLEGYGLEAFV